MYCGICKFENYPGVSLDNYILNRKMVCRNCMMDSLQKLKDDKIQWYHEVKEILLLKLYNNEPELVNTILSFIGINNTIDINKGHICSYCSQFIWEFHHDINERFYYFVCGDCLNL